MGFLDKKVNEFQPINCQIKYGTAGFRDFSDNILEIASKIGIGLSVLAENCEDRIGIMITASHNPSEYNGVKIVDQNGEMISLHDEKIMEIIVNSKAETLKKLRDTVFHSYTLIIGYDTRETCPEIVKRIVDGAGTIRPVNVEEYGKITTPELHYLTFSKENNYLNCLKEIKLNNNIKVDCAGGVGYLSLEKLNHPNVKLYCSPQTNKLNYHCGSDYVLKSNSLPDGFELFEDEIGCSLDGDGDRLIFYYKDKTGNLRILDGDHIMMLWALYLKELFKETPVVVVTTPYCNQAFEKFLREKQIDVIFRATGVKNLHHEAKKHEIAVYFEANGHGTALCKNKLSENFILNQLVGDGIYNIFTTLIILDEMKITVDDWYKMVTKNPFINFSISNKNLPEITCNKVGDRILNPPHFQEKIDQLSEKYEAKIFARPSGTEPIIRIYIETQNDIEKIKDEITVYFEEQKIN